MTRTATFDRILGLWDAALGRYEQNWGPRFKAYYVLGLDAPTISWSVFIGERLIGADLITNEQNFRKERPAIARPYVSIPASHEAAASTTLAEAGYAKENESSYCFSVKPFEDPHMGRFKIDSGDFESPRVFEDYAEATVSVFNLNDRGLPDFNRRFSRELAMPNRVLNFRHNGELAGTCCFTVVGDVCWLYGGSVYPKFRGKGMWRTMTAARQQMSRELGAKVWFLQTSHGYLSKNFETKLDFANFRITPRS